MTIYLDAVWLLNFFLDMMLLMLTQMLAKDSTRKLRIMFGAFVASLLVPLMVYYPSSFFTTLPGKLLYSIIIIVCSFRIHTIYQLIKRLLLFYFTTFSIGGGLIAIHFLLQSPVSLSAGGALTFNAGYGDPVSWGFVLTGFPLVWYFTKNRMDKHTAEKIRYDQLCPVTIQIGQSCYTTTGYIDSGNQLSDPLTKKPVIVCDSFFLKQWFTDYEWDMLRTAHDQLDFSVLPNDWENRLQIVPFQGVGGSRTFMLALKPEQVTLVYNDDEIQTRKVLIGIQFAHLTKDQSYHCLLHPQIIKNAVPISA
ncbi:sigma-E processing peptidase SpoIIGA [Barrientosiimonas marina]|uniref:Sporulation sigma-E factor-processing peptidase n=1 Tax=Lentibacillus kimchii TaxID=1542911 RepID=A0ABW2UPW9_9BACI